MYNPQLETFLRVADAGSFNKAAEELFITPPAVIKQIMSLESGLGFSLFVRSHRGLTLTLGAIPHGPVALHPRTLPGHQIQAGALREHTGERPGNSAIS